MFTSQIFFSSNVQRVQPFWVRIEKIIIPCLWYLKIKQWENLILWLQTCLQGSYRLPFFFKKPFFIFVTMMKVFKFGDLNLVYSASKTSCSAFNICFSYCHISGKRKLFRIYKEQIVIFIVVEDVIQFFGSNLECF